MKLDVQLKDMLATVTDPSSRLAMFAFVNSGVIDALANGSMSATDAIYSFYNADNCLYARKHLKNKLANRLMGHGVQLPDLFDILPAEEAQQAFLHELAAMRLLCLKLIEGSLQAA